MAKVAVMKETKDKDKKLRVGGKTLDKQRVLTFSVMLGAFLLAILMWFYVLGYDSPNFEKRFAGIDVSVSGAAELKEKNGFAVDVTVAGKKTDVNRLSSDDIRAYIDISSLTENGRVPVRIQVDLPNGIRLASLSTDTVYIYVDRSVTAEIELDVELTDYVLTNDLLLALLRAQNRHRRRPGGRDQRHFARLRVRRARRGSVVGHGRRAGGAVLRKRREGR